MQPPVPDEVLLGLIKAQPSHGYEMLDKFKSKSHLGRIWTMSTSQLYAVLKRLEEDGLIVGQHVVVKYAPSRIEYSITEEGDRNLTAWLNDENPSSSIHRLRVIFMSKLYIANLLKMPID
ncbi:MAG: PadR family transcriptional regulator, partial [Chloroflexota bacterium]|nr:PadR family transcriptional regulator [Chloroflexota bacterium]